MIVRVSLVVLLVIASGCVSTHPLSNQTETPTTEVKGTQETSEKKLLPEHPSNLSERRIIEFVFEYEQAYLHNRLRNDTEITSFGLGCCTGEPRATIVLENETATYVSVAYPYSYTKPGVEADAISRALYAVRNDSVARLEYDEKVTLSVDNMENTTQTTKAYQTIFFANFQNREQSIGFKLAEKNSDGGQSISKEPYTITAYSGTEVTLAGVPYGNYSVEVNAAGSTTERVDFTVNATVPPEIFVIITSSSELVVVRANTKGQPPSWMV